MGIEGAGLGDGRRVVGVGAARASRCLLRQEVPRRVRHRVAGWRPERELFGRLMKYGGPAGMQVFLDVLVFHLFTQLVGRLGDAASGATTLTVRLNMIAFLPMMGLGQAVCILVGQRLGENRPDLAEKSTYTGLKWTFGYMCLVALVYVAIPALLCRVVRERTQRPGEVRGRSPTIVPGAAAVRGGLLAGRRGEPDVRVRPPRGGRHAVRHAADVRLAWPLMVIPTALTRVASAGTCTGLGVRDRPHHRHGRLLLVPVPRREVEDRCG